MNNSDRKKLERLYHCLSIPGPAAGSQSASIKGFVSYSRDARFVFEKARQILYGMGCCEQWSGEIESRLKEIELWFEKRKSEGWD